MRHYMDRQVTPPKRVSSPTWGSPPPCKQALSNYKSFIQHICSCAGWSILHLVDQTDQPASQQCPCWMPHTCPIKLRVESFATYVWSPRINLLDTYLHVKTVKNPTGKGDNYIESCN